MAKVRAVERGYYGGAIREEGEEFDFNGPGSRPAWMELVAFGGKGDHDGDGRTGGSKPKDDDADLSGKTIPELRELAEAQGIDLAGITRKADIIAAIERGPDDRGAAPFSDAPEPQTLTEAQRAAGGIEPDWLPPEHQAPTPVDD